MNESIVISALKTAGAKYIDAAKRDILPTLHSFCDIQPGNEMFEFPDRVRRQAFRLKGTIPVVYKGVAYNIPIAVYLWDTHPYYAPICYVRPTTDMDVKISSSVDKFGKIFLPYLSEWRHPGYDLNGLLQVMTIIFQDSCPVFTRSQSHDSGSISTAQFTPYPSSNTTMPMPYGFGTGCPPYPTQNRSPYPAYPGQKQQRQAPAYPYQQSGTIISESSTNPNYQKQSSGGTIQPEHIKASLLSAIEDGLKQRLRDRIGTVHAELASIRQTQQDLHLGQHKLKQMLARLEQEQTGLDTAVAIYQNKQDELTRVLASVPTDDQLDIDSAVDTNTPLHRQLFVCYVDDCVIEDQLYFLGQALKKGAIPLDVYLKCIRKLSRQQFIQRVTMHKCRHRAGLAI